MSKFVALDYKITLDGDDFSDAIAAVNFDLSVAEQEVTAFGDNFVQRIGGLKDASVSLDFHQDFGENAVDATLHPKLGETIDLVVTPTSGAISPTNPAYEATLLVVEYSPFSSSIGDLATLSITLPLASGEVVRNTGA